MKESKFEWKCCQIAKSDEWWNIKLNTKTGWPDRLFIKGEKYMLVEFKRSSSSRRRKLQKYIISEMVKRGMNAYFCDNEEQFRDLLTRHGHSVKI